MTGDHALCHGAQLEVIDDVRSLLRDKVFTEEGLYEHLGRLEELILSCNGCCGVIPRARERIRQK